MAENEVEILEQLDHNNIVKFEYMYEEESKGGQTKNVNIVMEYMQGRFKIDSPLLRERYN